MAAKAELDDHTVELVSEFVELVHYEECRDFLQHHPELISQAVRLQTSSAPADAPPPARR
jgi:hypothetical protein